MRGIQVDNQLPLTPMPVIFRPQRLGVEADYVLKFSMTQQSDGSVDFAAYPYIGLQVSPFFSCSKYFNNNHTYLTPSVHFVTGS